MSLLSVSSAEDSRSGGGGGAAVRVAEVSCSQFVSLTSLSVRLTPRFLLVLLDVKSALRRLWESRALASRWCGNCSDSAELRRRASLRRCGENATSSVGGEGSCRARLALTAANPAGRPFSVAQRSRRETPASTVNSLVFTPV